MIVSIETQRACGILGFDRHKVALDRWPWSPSLLVLFVLFVLEVSLRALLWFWLLFFFVFEVDFWAEACEPGRALGAGVFHHLAAPSQ